MSDQELILEQRKKIAALSAIHEYYKITTEAAIKEGQEITELQAWRIRQLETLLRSIRGYMMPGAVMPVPDQAKFIVKWIDDVVAPGPH